MKVEGSKPVVDTKHNSSFFSREEGASFFQSGTTNGPFFMKLDSPSPVQTKLTVGQPGDKYEREADAMADKVVQRLPGNTAQPQPATAAPQQATSATGSPDKSQEEKLQLKEEDEEIAGELQHTIQKKPVFESNTPPDDIYRKCAHCEEEENVQRKESNSTSAQDIGDIENNLAAGTGKGTPLPPVIRQQMEQGFGTSFDAVRVHNDSAAMQMSESLGAQAFAHKNNIYFNSGKYDTGSSAGKRLLAHELTHVVQQRNGERIQRECNPAVSSCPGPNASESPALAPGTTHTPPVLARVQPLSEPDRATLQNAFGGAPLLNYINERDARRRQVEEKNAELTRITPEHGTPEPDGELDRRITRLRTEIETLSNDILRLDNLVQTGLEALGLTDENQLTTLINETFPALFIRRAKDIAITELENNKLIVEQEADRYGYNVCVDSAAKRGLIAAAQDLMARREAIADMEGRLRSISMNVPSAGVPSPETMGSDYYDYVRYPTRIAELRQEMERTQSGYILRFPILARPNLNLNAIATANEESVGDAVNSEITTIIENIEATKQNIRDEVIKVWNLRNIVSMTATDMGVDESPDLMAAVDRHVQQEISDEAALQMAITALAITAAIVATVATAGGALVVAGAAAGVGLGISISEAAASVQQYIAESRAENVALDPALADISAGEPSLTWVVMSLTGVVLDVIQVGAIFRAVRGTALAMTTAADVARLGQLARAAGASAVAAERLMTAGSNQLLRLALRETATQVGSAVALQAIANEFMGDEDAHMDIETRQLNMPARDASDPEAPVIHRQPHPLPPWVPPSLPTGDTFEARVEGMMRRGTLPGLPPMDHVIYGQYNRSGHGIDLIGIRVNPDTGVIYLYRVEVKGGIAPDLGRTRRGPQMGGEWTNNAIERMMDNPRLRGLLETRLGYNIGDSLSNPAVRQYILRRLRRAPSFVVAHSSAFLGRLGATVGGMRSRGSASAPRRIVRVP